MGAVHRFWGRGEVPCHNQLGISFGPQRHLAHRFFPLLFFSSLVFPSPPELRRGGCSLSPGRFAAWQAIGPSLQYPYSRDDEDASCPQLGERSVLHLRAPSGAARLRVVSSRTALPIH